MDDKNVHEGHRKRMRKSFLERDFSTMPDHEILEMLLYYARPRGDTNEIAHALEDAFGSVENVLSAPYEELVKINGIGDCSATLFVLFSKLSVRYVASLDDEKGYVEKDEVINDLIARFQHETKEKVIAVLFDKKGKRLNTAVLGSGGISDASFKPRELVETAIRCNASRVLLAHNHPQGFAVPSSTDVETTRVVKKVLAPLEIDLIDHLIVAGKDKYSIKQKYPEIF